VNSAPASASAPSAKRWNGGVGDHVDATDVKLRVTAVALARGLAREPVANLRLRQPGIRDHAGFDRVTEVDEMHACDDSGMPRKTLESLELELRDHAMGYPEATEDHPWGHIAIKVKGKAFLFLGGEQSAKELSLTVKLPQSRDMAVDLPFAQPTGYGLGKSGWVSARFTKAADVPMPLLKKWVDESYCAIAPKKLVKALA